jgi:hypothetical protein
MKRSTRLACVIMTVTLAVLSGCVNIGNDDDDLDFDGFPQASETIEGSGVVEEEERTVSGVRRVVFAGEGTLRITQGAAEQLLVTAEDNLLQHIRTSVQGGTLEIRTRSNVDLEPSEPITYDVTVVTLESLQFSGVGGVEVTNLNTAELEVVLSGVGNVDITGSVNVQNVTVKGFGNYNARDLSSREATISLDGNVQQTATVRVSTTLKVTISGNGTVFYIGDPAVDSDITGSGRLEKISG